MSSKTNSNIKNFPEKLVLPSMPEGLLLFLAIRIKKISVWKIKFVFVHLNTDQSQLNKCFALGACLDGCSPADSS